MGETLRYKSATLPDGTELTCTDWATCREYAEAALSSRQPDLVEGLPHKITPELIAGVGHGLVEAQGKAMDILEALLRATDQSAQPNLVEPSADVVEAVVEAIRYAEFGLDAGGDAHANGGTDDLSEALYASGLSPREIENALHVVAKAALSASPAPSQSGLVEALDLSVLDDAWRLIQMTWLNMGLLGLKDRGDDLSLKHELRMMALAFSKKHEPDKGFAKGSGQMHDVMERLKALHKALRTNDQTAPDAGLLGELKEILAGYDQAARGSFDERFYQIALSQILLENRNTILTALSRYDGLLVDIKRLRAAWSNACRTHQIKGGEACIHGSTWLALGDAIAKINAQLGDGK